jgi:hypothetical protein
MNAKTLPLIRRMPLPPGDWRRIYNFNVLQHGDMLEVKSVRGCQAMFRRWRAANGRNVRLVERRGRLYFADDDLLPKPLKPRVVRQVRLNEDIV